MALIKKDLIGSLLKLIGRDYWQMTDEVLFGTGMESSLIDEDSFTSVYGNSCRLYMKKYRNDIINQLVERDKHAFSFGFGLIPIIVSVLALVVSFIGLFT